MEKKDCARRVFADDRFASLTGIEIVSVGNNEACCTLTLDDRHRNARGAAMGGVLFTLADFCAAVAANSDRLDKTEAEGTPSLHWVSLDSNIHFLAPATDGVLTARCAPLKQGRTTALYQTIIESPGNGKQVAIVETTMIHV